ncbi:PadR family transcriptional regulator [Candidatus Bathyarchaeota archaeon]|nr:PadR family transcriptional regulator [Candidatus Bathyarchaeota archaeon]
MDSSNLLEKVQRRVIQDFMDIFILAEMKKSSLSGYDVIGMVQKRFGILVSSGTVYSLLYSLERDCWIRGVWNHRKRVYELAEKGERDAKVIAKVNEGVQIFLRNISLLNTTVNS